MRVAYITRATLYSAPGGDTTQIEQTALHLKKLGIGVDILLTNAIIDYSQYDLLHFFNIIRPADILYHIEASNKPFVVSTIFVDYSEFEKNNRKGVIGLLASFLPSDSLEYLKTIARSVVNGEKVRSPSYYWKGHYNSIRYIIKKAKVLLPNSKSEYDRLVHHFKADNNYLVIPNAVDLAWQDEELQELEEYKDSVICVGSIEGRKNQLALIRGLKNSSIKLTIIGSHSPNHRSYYELCQAEAGTNVKFLDRVTGKKLYQIYKSAKVHVLPSFFETTGLSSLEAALMGCNLVITDKGDTEEYFEDMAFYCNPYNPQSVRIAVEKAMEAPFNENLRKKIKANYTWEITAAKTLDAYKRALSL